MPITRVLVVGAGPAGLVAAIALRRVGVDVDVVEIESALRPAGVGVNLQNAPLRALDSLGLLDAIERAGSDTGVVHMLTATGLPIMQPLRPPSLVPGRPAAIGIGRGALSSILVETVAREGLRIRFGVTVDAFSELPDAVRATFDDGTIADYDLVIGADGLHSRVRALAFGADSPEPTYTGQSIWRASAPRADLAEYQLLNGPTSKVGLVPISEDRMYLYLLEAAPDEPDRQAIGDLDAALQHALAPFGGGVPAVAGRLEPGADLRGLKTLMMDDPWYRGRVLLIGDAAHASTPHISYGLGIAIEDGIVLAELVARRDDVPTVLREFMRRRYDRCSLVVANSRQLGVWELDPPSDRSRYGALMAESLAVLAQPI